MKDELPNPALEGYRTAFKQNSDGSYKNVVMVADIFPGRSHKSGCSRRMSGEVNKPRAFTPVEWWLTGDVPTRVDPTLEESGSHDPRFISKKMETVYRLRHHDFEGKSEEETARMMEMNPDAVRRLMWEMCKQAPHLFPILTPAQARAWHLWYHEGMSYNMIAEVMGVSVNAVTKRVGKAKAKLKYHDILQHRLIVMDPRRLDQLQPIAKF